MSTTDGQRNELVPQAECEGTMSEKPTVIVLPLIFTYRDPIVGNGFLATVAVRGRALARIESGEGAYVEAVQPAGFAGVGSTLAEAHADFRQAFTTTLIELAADAKSVADFRSAVDAFGGEISEPAFEDWKAAVEQVRANATHKELDMPSEPAELMPYVRVQHKDPAQLTPADNALLESKPTIAA